MARAASIDPSTSGFATIREVYSVKDEVLAALAAMEVRLTARIEAANVTHETTHAEMRRVGERRHEVIDRMLKEDEETELVKRATDAGRSDTYKRVIGTLRAVNEFRVLLGIAIAALLFLVNDLHVSIVGS
jgi:hypothetical protein